MKSYKKGLRAGLLAVGLALSGCDDGSQATLVSTTRTLEDMGLTTFSEALRLAELDDDVDSGTFSVLAPTEAAFNALTPDARARLFDVSNRPTLTGLMRYHLLPGNYSTSDLVAMSPIVTEEGLEAGFSNFAGSTYANHARIETPNVPTTSGRIHVIDHLLRIPHDVDWLLKASGDPSFRTMFHLVLETEFDGELAGPGPFTLLAPTDEAFEALPKGALEDLFDPANREEVLELLRYHVIPGRFNLNDALQQGELETMQGSCMLILASGNTPNANGERISTFNFWANNGVVHAVDAVLTLPVTIPDTLEALGLTKFLNILEHANLADGLREDGTWTCFAPTNEAIESMPPGLLEELLMPQNRDRLRDLLFYHFHQLDRLRSAEVGGLQTLRMRNREDVQITSSAAGLRINDADVVQADEIASNGILHVINQVLIPPSDAELFQAQSDSVAEWTEAAESSTSREAVDPLHQAMAVGREILSDALGVSSEVSVTDPGTMPIWLIQNGSHLAGWEAFNGPGLGQRSPDAFASSAMSAFLVQRNPLPSRDGAEKLEDERAAYSVLDEVPLDLHMVLLLVRGVPLDRDAATLIARAGNGERLELHPSAIESSALSPDEGLFLLWSDLPGGIFRYSLDFTALVPGQEPSSVHLLAVW